MADHVYSLTEIVGSSPSTIDEAIRNALDRARKTLRHLDWFEVTQIRGQLGASVEDLRSHGPQRPAHERDSVSRDGGERQPRPCRGRAAQPGGVRTARLDRREVGERAGGGGAGAPGAAPQGGEEAVAVDGLAGQQTGHDVHSATARRR